MPVPGLQQRVLLALLLLEPNRVVSVDALIADLWNDRPPANARVLLHGCVARLRRVLRAVPARPAAEHPAAEHPAPEHPAAERPAAELAGPEHAAPERPAPERAWPEHAAPERTAPERAAAEHPAAERTAAERTASERAEPPLVSRPPGYLLAVRPDELDLLRFDELTAAAGREPEPERRRDVLAAALALWRGPALDGLTPGRLAAAAAGLDERRLTVLEQRIDLDLGLGRHAVLAGELRTHVRAHPLRERLWAQLMLALAGAGRRADALAAYQELRGSLVDQLGIEPGPLPRRLHQAVLSGADPTAVYLDTGGPPAAPTAGRPPAAGALAAGPLASGAPAAPTGDRPPAAGPLAQLPLDVSGFTGRGAELAELDVALAAGREPSAVRIAAVCGTAGVGKTALAVRWAHRGAARLPAGQLYVDLRGYAPGWPVDPLDALAGMLTALGVPERDIPPTLDARAARYRSAVAGRRLLVLLDNAATVEQVHPLLPGSPDTVVLVTSRDSLPGLVALHGARRLALDLMPAADARALLRELIGARVDGEPDAAAELAALCGRLPLALRVAAELAVSRPTTPLADLVAELADRRRRLDLLDPGGDPHAAVITVFSWSLRHLPPDTMRAFALLGLHPGQDADAPALAALAGTGHRSAGRMLTRLARAHLVYSSGPGRYGMHELLRAYATGLVRSDGEARAALGRLLDHYLGTAAAAMDALFPADAGRRPTVPSPAVATPAADAPRFDTPAAALAWLDTHRATLTAVAGHAAGDGWPRYAIDLSATLFPYLAGGHYHDGLAIHAHGVTAARLAGDRTGEARAGTDLGNMQVRLGRHGEAVAQFRRAVDLYQQVGDHSGQARGLNNIGVVEQRQGRHTVAAGHFRQALEHSRQAGDRIGEAWALNNLGTVAQLRGSWAEAVRDRRRALELFRQAGDQIGQAEVLNNLGDLEQRQGQHAAALGHYRQALAGYQQAGSRVGEAWARSSLGDVHTLLGEPDRAAEQLCWALALFRELGDLDGEPWVLTGLGDAARAAGRPAEALRWHTTALTAALGVGSGHQEARAHIGLAHAHRDLGDPERATTHHDQAVLLHTRMGVAWYDQARSTA